MKVCSERIPDRIEAEPGHFCACHLYDTSLSDADRTPQVAHAIEAAQKAVEEARLEEKISEQRILLSCLKTAYKHKKARRPIDLLAFVFGCRKPYFFLTLSK